MSEEKPSTTVIVSAMVVGLVLAAILVVWGFGWLFGGHVLFGLTIGLMVGMSKSAVVSAALPLLFAFAGGSIVSLSITGEPTDAQLDTLGKQLAGFGIGTIIGVLVGVVLRINQIELLAGKFRD